MRLVGSVPLPDTVADAVVIERLQDVDVWPSWVLGLRQVARGETVYEGSTTTPRAMHVTLCLRAPRTLTFRVEVVRSEEGIDIALVEGDLAELRGSLVVRDGCMHWDVVLHAPVVLPGPLYQELRREILPRWAAALLRAPAPTSPAPPGTDPAAD